MQSEEWKTYSSHGTAVDVGDVRHRIFLQSLMLKWQEASTSLCKLSFPSCTIERSVNYV